MQFQKATKKQSKLRMAIVGPSGSGKTMSALKIAAGLGQKIAVIDSERGSASKYADQFGFDVLELDGDFSPVTYTKAIQAAEAGGYDVVIIDSLSHAWEGTLGEHDKAVKRSRSGNSFNAWKDVTPLHNNLVQSILGSRCHVIATMRVKTEWVQEKDERGKTVPRKVGLAPIQRAGVEYEFDVVGDMDHNHDLVISKTRCSALDNGVFNKPGADVAQLLSTWLSDGAPVEEKPVSEPVNAIMSELEERFQAVADTEALEAAKEAVRSHWAALAANDRTKVLELKKQAEERLAS